MPRGSGNSSKRLCQCHAHGCYLETSSDPLTGELVTGQYIDPSTFKKHQFLERVWAFNRAESDARQAILAATMHSSEGASIYDRDWGDEEDIDGDGNEHAGEDDSDADVADVGESEDDRGDVTETYDANMDDLPGAGTTTNAETSNAHESLDESKMDVDVEDFGHSGESTVDVLATIESYHQHFHSAKDTFQMPVLCFGVSPKSPFDPVPRLAVSTGQRRLNHALIFHRNLISRTQRRIEKIHVNDATDPEVVVSRRNLLLELDHHTVSLDRDVETQWYIRKIDEKLIEAKDESSPRILNTSQYFMPLLGGIPTPAILSLFVVLVTYLLYGVSRSTAGFLLDTFRMVIGSTCMFLGALGIPVTNAALERLVSRWPTDKREAGTDS
ncbi:hypothetical protein OF83DRAFT_1171476 [Amylostereum chailletii]|nr:hypothetical protein OF83DRAFT_1171476 [Amylostereum chailletii]